MARGNQKTARGKKNKGFIPHKKQHNEKKYSHSSHKRSKSYSNQSKNVHSKTSERIYKRAKIDKSAQNEILESSSEDELDGYKKLLSTFNSVEFKSKKRAIESDDSEVDVENVKQTNHLGASSGDETQQSMRNVDVSTSDDDDGDEDSDHEEMVEYQDEETEKEDTEDSLDPFVDHFHYDLNELLLEAVSSQPPAMQKQEVQWPVLGQLSFSLPREAASAASAFKHKACLQENKTYAKPGTIPNRIHFIDWSKLCIKSQIQNNVSKANYCNLSAVQVGYDASLTPLQKELFSIINNYQDLYFPARTLKNSEEVRFVYCLHAVNHVIKTRIKILHHNAKLSRKEEVPDEFRDQGLVRPKVLILVPFRESALRVVKMIIKILLPDEKANVVNKARFFDEFSGSEIAMPRKNPRPDDYEATFVGNTDDTFRIGMTVTKKSLKLYADFYSADIIVASPLGLRVIIGAEGEAGREYDFLASIEVLVLDQTELFFMQNWNHLLHVLDHLHLQPREAHNTDFSRVRSWAVNGWARFYRQTILLSSIVLPEINAVFNKKCDNYAGKVRVVKHIANGTICQVVVQLPQVFQKLDVNMATKAIDSRFEYFTKKILPQYKDSIMNHTMIYIPSYFDYVRVRNFFKREDLSFVQLCEYSKEAKIARARDMFFHSEAHFLIYSERFHFFRRLRIKGIRHIIFYQPPNIPHFYSELCNLMQEANQSRHGGNESNMTVTVLYSKFDAQQLAAIVGTDRASRMLTSERDVHMFMAGK